MSEFALSRTLDPKDYGLLQPELQGVDCFDLSGQHEHRRWEYAIALHAIRRWQATSKREIAYPIYDVGGAGSPLDKILEAWTHVEAIVIDPKVADFPLETAATGGLPLADIVTCISVIEHVPDLDHFLYLLSCIVAPGGLLVLTMDYWNKCGPDTAHFSHMRQRIFCPKTYGQLRTSAAVYHLLPFGGVDTLYHGQQVYDYTFASLVLEKRR